MGALAERDRENGQGLGQRCLLPIPLGVTQNNGCVTAYYLADRLSPRRVLEDDRVIEVEEIDGSTGRELKVVLDRGDRKLLVIGETEEEKDGRLFRVVVYLGEYNKAQVGEPPYIEVYKCGDCVVTKVFQSRRFREDGNGYINHNYQF